MTYRSDIDGIRALAVLMVIVFHSHLALPGGYVGVDVFFVLSGFLITTLILKDLENGKFSIVEFWERRARRLMPALFAMVLVTLAAAWFILLPADYVALAKSGIAQAGFAANIFFWRHSGYFDGASEEKPLLHTWSLAVEEQFYMVVPLLLLLVYKFAKNGRIKHLRTMVLLIGGASFALSLYSVQKHPLAAFFLLPSRAWELLMGSAVAIFPLAGLVRGRAVREGLGWLGLILILLPCFLYGPETPFPGLAAFPPCLGTAMLLVANGRQKEDESYVTRTGALLSSKPLVFLGLISYSLYLWHWPVFVFGTYSSMGNLGLWERIGMIALSLVLGTLSWKFVETPFRLRKLAGTRKRIFLFAGAGMALSAALCAGLILRKGVPKRYPADVMAVYNKSFEKFSSDNHEPADVDADRVRHIGVVEKDRPVSLLVWGDSHARCSLPAFDEFCKKRGLAGRAITYSGTAPLVDYVTRDRTGLNERTPEWAAAVLKYVRDHHIPNVALVCRWENELLATPREKLRRNLTDTIRALNKEGAMVWVLIQVPNHKVDIPKLLVRAMLTGEATERYRQTGAEYHAQNELFFDLKEHPETWNAKFLDPSPYFTESASDRFVIEKNGDPLYVDGHHLTIAAALERLGKLFDKEMDQINPIKP